MAQGAAWPFRRPGSIGVSAHGGGSGAGNTGLRPVESWTLEAQLRKQSPQQSPEDPFTAVLHSVKGQKSRLTVSNEQEARSYQAQLDGAAYTVGSVKKKDVRQRPAPPFITSTLQQEAGRKLRFTAQRTMAVAQQLYEGLAVGNEGSVGLITYMRTDSTQVAASALSEVRSYIGRRYGKDYLPDKPRVYARRAKGAQEAHEAIRPTSIGREPQAMKPHLTADQFNLYKLVWERMLASQMSDARSEATTVDIDAACRDQSKTYTFRATGSVLKFPGFRTVYLEGRDDGAVDSGRQPLPELAADEPLDCLKLDALQHFTEPPPRFTEATLIKAMEEKGIGRPSTYAPTIGTLLDRHYVSKERTRLVPTPLGCAVTDLLVEYFTQVMDLEFTAHMEEELDDVSRGERQWVPMLTEFYGPFQKALEEAQESMPRRKVEEETDEVCEACGKPMVIKTGRFGRFLACTGFPECRTSRPILKKTGAACPRCGGDIVERRARGRGRTFFGCSNYPRCDLIMNPEACGRALSRVRRPHGPLRPQHGRLYGLRLERTASRRQGVGYRWRLILLPVPPPHRTWPNSTSFWSDSPRSCGANGASPKTPSASIWPTWRPSTIISIGRASASPTWTASCCAAI